MTTIKVTDGSFADDVLNAKGPVLVDFWAEWCGPCKQIAPTLEEIAGERRDLTIAKVNIDENPEAPVRYGVRSIPTLMIFHKGEAVATKIGSGPKSSFETWINGVIGSPDVAAAG